MIGSFYQRFLAFVVTVEVISGSAVAQLPGLPGDYHRDGWITHADYGVLAHWFGTDVPMPNRGISGTISMPDFIAYDANFGNWDEISPPVVNSASLPFTVVRFATADGDTQWVLKSRLSAGFAANLNIKADAPFQSIGRGSQFMRVPGLNMLGQIRRGVGLSNSFSNNQAFAALGTSLGVPSSEINGSSFVTFFTQGTQPMKLSLFGEYGIAQPNLFAPFHAVNYTFAESLEFDTPAPGSSPTNPVLPDEENEDFVFNEVPSGIWFDPPLVAGFEYSMVSDSLFTSILDFPPGFDAPFRVSVDGLVLGSFTAGQSLDFVSLLGRGVERFTVADISPSVDAEDPRAFPLRIAFSSPTASFRMKAIPEPSIIIIGILACAFIVIRRFHR